MESEGKFDLKPGLEASASILVAMLILSAIAWGKIPAGQPIATHWGLDGQPDGYSSKSFALLLSPVMALVIAGVFMLIFRIDPRRSNIKLSGKALTSIWIATMAFILVTHAFVILTALGWKSHVNVIISATGLLFIVAGNYLPKLRSNFFAGIRTPWTLSSELSWSKTHRLGGRLFIFLGLIMLVAGFLLDTLATSCLLPVGMLAIVAFLAMYSYVIWKSDPNKTGANGEVASTNGATMKKTLIGISIISVIVIASLVFVVLSMRPPSNITPRAQAVVHAMNAEDFPELATKDFDSTMKKALPPEKLKSTWLLLTPQFGPFQRELSVRTAPAWPFTIVYVTCKFEKADAAFKVVFSPSGKISGLWITPAQ